MKATLPAVQFSCKRVRRVVCMSARVARNDKRCANRRHRRYLNLVTRAFILDPEAFDEEPFTAPTLSAWDLY